MTVAHVSMIFGTVRVSYSGMDAALMNQPNEGDDHDPKKPSHGSVQSEAMKLPDFDLECRRYHGTNRRSLRGRKQGRQFGRRDVRIGN